MVPGLCLEHTVREGEGGEGGEGKGGKEGGWVGKYSRSAPKASEGRAYQTSSHPICPSLPPSLPLSLALSLLLSLASFLLPSP